MLKEETIAFLKSIPPLNLLGEKELEEIAEEIALEYYPRGMKILAQNGPPSEHLRIIKKGGVKVFMTSDEGAEIVIDYRSEGEQFGLLSVISGDRSRANVVALEDTICYQIPKKKVIDIFQKNPAVSEYFLKSFFINFIDKTYEETRKRYYSGASFGAGERLLFTTPVGAIVTRQPVTVSEDDTIREAATVMARNRISSTVVVDGAGVPEGIVTDRDLREKVVARGRELSDPVKSIMSSPLVKADAEEYCFEALLRMMHYNIHHILVVEKGSFKGIVTTHDFMVLQGSAPTVLAKEVSGIRSPEMLGRTASRLHKTVAALLREGARARYITGFITELSEKLINRASDVIEKKIGPSPLPYTLFTYDDGGRRELTLALPVKLGVIFEDTHNLPSVRATEQYFKEFTDQLGGYLSAYGASGGRPCISSNEVRSLSDWKDLFERWASAPIGNPPRAEFFDMRAIRGMEGFVESLRDFLFRLASSNEEMMDLVATQTVSKRPPLGFFKRFVVEKSGEHKNELDIYENGIRPLVNSIRIFSVEKGLTDVTTVRRIKELREKFSFEMADDVEHVLEYLLALLVHNQLLQVEKGHGMDSFINPASLSTLERKTLKESFHLITLLYDVIEKSYRTERVR